MLEKNIKIKKIDIINWPKICPNCGQAMRDEDIVSFALKIRRTLKTVLTGGFGLKRLNIILCGTCARKVSKFKSVETAGSIIIFFVVLVILVKGFKENYLMYIGAAAFWIGIIMMGVGEVAAQKFAGMECKLQGAEKWELKIKNDNFNREFRRLNSKIITWK